MIAARQIAFGKAAGAAKPYKARLEYIRNEGTNINNMSFLLFDYAFALDDDVTIKLSDATPLVDSGGYGLFGRGNGISAGGWRKNDFSFYSTTMWVGDKDRKVTSLPLREIEEVVFRDKKAYVNGVFGADFSDAMGESGLPQIIFGIGQQYSYTPAYGILANFKQFTVIRNGEKIFDAIPVLDFDDNACAYDTVADKFYYSPRTGLGFIAGPEI